MPNRIIKESICESRKLSDVSFFAEDLYKRLITYADDYGRFNADAQIMLARLYPREIQIVGIFDIEDALIELTGIGKIQFYTSKARHEVYGCFPNWQEHQRIRDSKGKCPEPDNTEVNDYYLRRFVPRALRARIIERDGFKCKECGKFVCAPQITADRLIKMGAGLYHIDHIVPVNQGGRSTEENLRLLCPKCNMTRKRFFTFDELLEQENDVSRRVAASCGELRPESESESKSESKLSTRARAREADAKAKLYESIDAEERAVSIGGLFNLICEDQQSVIMFPKDRIKAILAVDKTVEEFGGWEKLFRMVHESDFLSGRTGKWNGCGLDWILKPENLVRIMEGNYRNKDEASDQPPASYDIEEMERRLIHGNVPNYEEERKRRNESD